VVYWANRYRFEERRRVWVVGHIFKVKRCGSSNQHETRLLRHGPRLSRCWLHVDIVDIVAHE
jgi:hypothetical protein